MPRKIDGDEMVEALEVENVKTGEMRVLPVSGVFLYIGQVPNTAWLKDTSNSTSTATSSPTNCCARAPARRVRRAATRTPTRLKQIAMAVGEGALAAVQAERYLDTLECAVPGAVPAGNGAAGTQR